MPGRTDIVSDSPKAIVSLTASINLQLVLVKERAQIQYHTNMLIFYLSKGIPIDI